MSRDAGQEARKGVARDRLTGHVEHDARGWPVALSTSTPGRTFNQLRPVTCETFDDTRRIAYRLRAHTRPCELIVHDARDPPASHELIEGHHT